MYSIKLGHVIFIAGGTMALYLFLHRLTHSQPASSPPPECSRPEYPARDSPSQSWRQMKGVRLCQVYPPPESETATDIDVIAIHGLDTDSPRTWTWEHKDPKLPAVNWLKDPNMLPKRIPTVRIFTCNWPADLFERPDLTTKMMDEFARLLLAGIKNRPPATSKDPGRDNRPIVFIASCLGGVVLMKALVMATGEYDTVKQATRGMIFLATPFRGTSFEAVAKWAEPGLRAWAFIRDENVSNLLQHVKSTFELEELVRSFTTFCQDQDLYGSVFTFYETGKTSLPRKIVPCLPAFLSQEQPLVNRQSATLDFVPHPLALDRTHIQMNKFEDPNDPGYNSVVGTIETLLRKVRNGLPVEIANIWIRNKRYSLENLEIERLSGDRLPMDRCYINLAIVKQPSDKADRSREEDTIQQSSPFSLPARLKVETPEEGIEVTLPTLFEPRKTRDGQKTPSRILIRGRAGVGKSTLCKKIVYEFTYGTLWRHLFDCVLWVPLRNLKLGERRQIAGYNFRHLFYHEYFSQHPEGDKLAEALWHTLKDTNRGRILFILDGLDEVSQDLEGDILSFLEELLNQSNVIITCRPNAILPAQLDPLHLELETIGFYPDQVKAYIKNAFTDPETQEPDSRKIEEVQSFLHQHQLIQSLVRIPIQLDAFCYTWNGSRNGDVQETMTAIYKNIEHSLWKKDAINLDKRTRHQMQVARPKEISKSIKEELYVLEILAFTGMYNDVIDFEPKYRDAISEHFDHDMNVFLDDMLGRVSFLRSSDLLSGSRDRNYHFLHLTFQEYFGARYFVRQWEAKKDLKCLVLGNKTSKNIDPASFIRRHKYNARFDVFWRFTAGLLDTEAKTIRFFQAIEEPRDLLGPTHQRLVMHCLSEVSIELPLRKELEDQLLHWLVFECWFTNKSKLSGETELPLKVLEKCFQQESKKTQALLIIPLSTKRPFKALPEELLQAIAAQLEDKDRGVREAAVKILKSQPALSEEFLRAIAARLEHEDWGVKYAAVKILKSQPALSEEFLQAIAARLEHEDSGVRRVAVETLGSRPALSEEFLQAIAARLEDENSDVREAAVESLGSQPTLSEDRPTLSEEFLQAIAARLEDEDSDVREAAVESLGSRPTLSEDRPTLSEEFLQAIAARLEHEDSGVKYAAVKILKSQPALSEEFLQAIAVRLKDKYWGVRKVAVETLSSQPALSEEFLQAIAARLEDEDSDVRQVAVETLGSRPTLSEEFLQAIAARLKDEKSGVRRVAVKSLGSRPTLSEEFLPAIAARLEDENSDVRQVAIETLGSRPALSEEFFRAIAARLEDKYSGVKHAAVKTLINQEVLSIIPNQSRSFYEHLSWHVIDKFSYISRGLEEYSEGCQDQFINAIREAQKDLGIPD
ncbi:ARM repeat-containing protein [Xylariaceae sp. AK1471]|nr:ARM repeat-containing protein [Xylariaceae sp. AK1471]